ncbi:MAG: alpha/beta hydrolase, partial [Planctomycetota bacterium]|nr:alpha/beta hydrolase [Planctomycetota bacterium]
MNRNSWEGQAIAVNLSMLIGMATTWERCPVEKQGPPQGAKKSAWQRRWRNFLWFAVGMLGGIVFVFALLETSIVYPVPNATSGNWNPQFRRDDVYFRSADGTSLHGWYLPHEDPQRSILFLHGNGEHVPTAAESMAIVSRQLQADVFVFDYRGYGRSEGRPTESGVLADAEAALMWLCQRTKRHPVEIILYGRSLGGAVAVHLAAEHGASHLVLERTFTRLTDVAAYHFPWLPVRLVMRNQYPSVDKIKHYTGPLFQSHGTDDIVVPYLNGRQLYDASPSPLKEFATLSDCGHNDPNPEAYWQK